MSNALKVQNFTFSNKAEPCNSAIVSPRGKKHICRQKHVKITLKALQEDLKVIDEQVR